VLFTPATTPVAQLAKAHAGSRLEERLTHYAKPKLMISIHPPTAILPGVDTAAGQCFMFQ